MMRRLSYRFSNSVVCEPQKFSIIRKKLAYLFLEKKLILSEKHLLKAISIKKKLQNSRKVRHGFQISNSKIMSLKKS